MRWSRKVRRQVKKLCCLSSTHNYKLPRVDVEFLREEQRLREERNTMSLPRRKNVTIRPTSIHLKGKGPEDSMLPSTVETATITDQRSHFEQTRMIQDGEDIDRAVNTVDKQHNPQVKVNHPIDIALKKQKQNVIGDGNQSAQDKGKQTQV